ncbi:MAG: dockerin type I domain-containing protein [Phycisphaerae bacterium]|nr:dockerin type I domain-containing protein [Phycisphaerae bacterium]
MKVFLILTLVLGTVPIALGQDSLKVYWPDGTTPFDCNSEIMVGDKRVLVISSESNDYGNISVFGVFIAGDDRLGGILAGRGLDPNDPNARDYTGSHLENAGLFARVTQWRDSDIWGFDFFTFYPVDAYSEPNSTVPGDWFVIDYHAIKAGDINVGFYIYNDDEGWDEPNYIITFHNVPTRDLNSDEAVDFLDFATFSSHWNDTDCCDPNWCAGADIDRDGDVDNKDLGLFIEYWLWPDSGNEPDIPDEPDYPEDANVIYSIVDVNGLSEITIDVNESITLYVDIASTTENNARSFYIDIDISDPNLGSIDNTEHPDGTAQILAEPNRLPFADYWGPGLGQEEGIQLSGATLNSAIADGHLASFVFTCEGQGDVTLELKNWASFNTDNEAVFPKMETIVIHQIDPLMTMGMGMDSEMLLGTLPDEIDIDKLVSLLEELWLDDKEIKKIYDKTEWDDFINSVLNLY